MKSFKNLFLMVILSSGLLLLGVSHAETELNQSGEVVEKTNDGLINWTSQTIEAKGCAEKDQSVFKQKLSAEVLARTNLLKVLDGVHLKSEKIIRDGRLQGEISTEKMEGFLKHAYVSDPVINSIGLLEVTAYTHIDKDGRAILFAPTYFSDSKAGEQPTFPSLNSTINENKPEEIEPVNYTGLIIDATGLSVKPVLLPRLMVDGELGTLYSPIQADDREYLIKEGYCVYASTLDMAKQAVTRVGSDPLIVKAIRVSSDGADFIVDAVSAKKILQAQNNNDILNRGKLMIVVNKFK